MINYTGFIKCISKDKKFGKEHETFSEYLNQTNDSHHLNFLLERWPCRKYCDNRSITKNRDNKNISHLKHNKKEALTTSSKVRNGIFPTLSSMLLVVGLLFCGIFGSMYTLGYAQNVTSDVIQKSWKTPDNLKSPESVFYSVKDDILYVSNIDGQPDKYDQKGFISKVLPVNGTIIQLNWVNGLNAPKGVSLAQVDRNNTMLYVADITDLVSIDPDNSTITKRYHAPGSIFLNDVTSDKMGNIYVSDTANNSIYILERNLANGSNSTINDKNNSEYQMKVWLHDPQLNAPNGLVVDNDNGKLIVVSMGSLSDSSKKGTIQSIDLKNKTISALSNGNKSAAPVGKLDGIVIDPSGQYLYVTDYNAGKLFRVNSNGTGYEMIAGFNATGTADLGYVSKGNLLVVPVMKANHLQSFEILD